MIIFFQNGNINYFLPKRKLFSYNEVAKGVRNMSTKQKKPRNRIAELRKEKHLTIQQLADELGVANGTISRYEQGSREPKLSTWEKLADIFNVSVSYITGVSDEPGKDSSRLRSIRNAKHLSIQQVADAYNQEADKLSVFDHKEKHISAQTIENIENGNYQPSKHEWELLAWSLNVPQFYLSGHSNDKIGWQEWAEATGYSVDQLKTEVQRLIKTGRIDQDEDIQRQIGYAVQSLDGHVPTTTTGTINCIQEKIHELLNDVDNAFLVQKSTTVSPDSSLMVTNAGDTHVRKDMDEQAYKQIVDILNETQLKLGQIHIKR